jgi:hypothetical protein
MTIIQTQTNKALEDIKKINLISENLENLITEEMKSAYVSSYSVFWDNPIEICEEAGNQAHILFQKHLEMGQKIQERDPDFVQLTIPDEWEVAFNQDGSVIVTEKPEE